MAGTAVYNAADALAALLSARSELQDRKLTVVSGFSGEVGQPLDAYVSWDAPNWAQNYLISASMVGSVGLGANVEESFILAVKFIGTSTDRFRARDLVLSVVNTVADVCQSDRTLNGTVQLARVTNLVPQQVTPEGENRNHQFALDVYVTCTAWIDPGV